jgi:hypothetical protein
VHQYPFQNFSFWNSFISIILSKTTTIKKLKVSPKMTSTASGTTAKAKTSGTKRVKADPMDHENVAVQLTKSIQNIGKQQDGFKKAVDQFNELFTDVELRIQAKQKELTNLDEHFLREKKNKEIDLSQSIRQFGYDEAVRILAERKQQAVSMEEFSKLQKDYANLVSGQDRAVAEAVAKEEETSRRNLEHAMHTAKLEYEMKQAKESAENKQLQQQIQILNNQVDSLRGEIEAQRVLTKDVASAQAQANASRFAQGFGSGNGSHGNNR